MERKTGQMEARTIQNIWKYHATQLYSCHGVFIDRFIFRSNLLWMRLPWECHNQSQDTYWRHCVTGPELLFFHKRKGVLKIDQPVKMPWHSHASSRKLPLIDSCFAAKRAHWHLQWCSHGRSHWERQMLWSLTEKRNCMTYRRAQRAGGLFLVFTWRHQHLKIRNCQSILW